MQILRNSLVQAILLVLILRAVSIVHYYLSEDTTTGPMNMIPVSLAYHSLVFLIFLFLSLLFARYAIKSYQKLEPLLLIFSFGFLILGQADFLMLRQIGQHFTPSVFMTFSPLALLDRDVLQPLMQDTAYTVTSFGILMVGLTALGLICISRRLQKNWNLTTGHLIFCLAVILGLGIGVFTDRPLQQAATRPPEIAFLTRLVGLDKTPAPDNIAASREHLRSLVPLSKGWTWSKTSPLTRIQSNPSDTKWHTQPDVVLLVVESLRAANLDFISNSPQTAHTPNMDRLAQQGVVFSQFMANGFPSSSGFFSLNTGLWPHPSKIALTDLMHIRVPSLPGILRQQGYRTEIFWGVNPDFDNQLPWARRWYDTLHYQVPGNIWKHNLNKSDAFLIDEVIQEIGKHDLQTPGKPLFLYAATCGTHVPFTTSGLYFANEAQRQEALSMGIDQTSDANERYNKTLELLDRQIGRLWDALQKRKRNKRTVLIITGDHSIPTTEPDTHESKRLPLDRYLWTGALVVGPEHLIGPPRKESFPASQVDLMPTLLKLTGKTHQITGNGADLFSDVAENNRVSISLREGGYRMNRPNVSLVVTPEHPENFQIISSGNKIKGKSSPLQRKDAATLVNVGEYWKYLLEQDRVAAQN